MGIKNLKKFIRDNFPQTIKDYHISKFSNEKITIDISSFIYKYKIIFKEKWLNCFINFITILKKYKVHATFIFDGKPPPEKDKEKQKRREQKESIDNEVMNISIDLDLYKSENKISNLLIKTMEKICNQNDNINKLNRLLKNYNKEEENENNNILINTDMIQNYIKKKEQQLETITKDDVVKLKNLFELFGSSYIQAEGEAEATASYLVSIKESKAVLSEDTDTLVYGTDIFLFDLNIHNGYCKGIDLNYLLENLNYSFEKFRDFCILSGTDYNDNIKGLACTTIYKKIFTKYNSIEDMENLEQKIYNDELERINYKVSRELFSTFGRLKNKNIKCKYWNSNIQFDKLYNFLNKEKCKYSMKEIEELWKDLEIEFEE